MRRYLAIAALLAVLDAQAAPVVGWVGIPLIADDGVSEGVEVPNVIGAVNAAAAESTLEGVGLDIGTVTPRCSAETADEVVGQNPAPGVLVELASLVDVLTSNGTECSLSRPGVTMPGVSIGL